MFKEYSEDPEKRTYSFCVLGALMEHFRLETGKGQWNSVFVLPLELDPLDQAVKDVRPGYLIPHLDIEGTQDGWSWGTGTELPPSVAAWYDIPGLPLLASDEVAAGKPVTVFNDQTDLPLDVLIESLIEGKLLVPSP